jgi:hypothetical protein
MIFSINQLIKLFWASAFLSFFFYLSFVIFRKGEDIQLYMFTYFEAFIVFTFTIFLIKRAELNNHNLSEDVPSFLPEVVSKKIFRSDEDNIFKYKIPLIIILFGVLFRLLLFYSSPSTSDDIHRYVWEAKVILNGYNPYYLQPNSEALEHLRDNNYKLVTFKHIPAIYPPAAQIGFVTSYFLSGGRFWGFKLVYLICEIITMIFLLKLLILKKHNPNYVLFYAWLPLSIMEYFINIHLDAQGIMFFVLFIYFIEKDNYKLSSVFYALSFLSKFLPVFILPLLLRKLGFKKSLMFGLIFIAMLIIFYLPFFYQHPNLVTGLFTYLSRWEFNASVYNLFKFLFNNGYTARIICAALLVISVIVISLRYKDFVSGVFGVFLCLIIFSTTLYPWYLGWISVLNPFSLFYSVFSLQFTSNFSNFTPLGDKWKEYTPVLLVQYLPFFVLLYYDIKKRFLNRN